jgi:hypothetical protein
LRSAPPVRFGEAGASPAFGAFRFPYVFLMRLVVPKEALLTLP